ncbi:hypothetical protein EON65_52725, partial [archaeon]
MRYDICMVFKICIIPIWFFLIYIARFICIVNLHVYIYWVGASTSPIHHVFTRLNEYLYECTCVRTYLGTLHGEIKIFEKHDDLKEKYQVDDTVFVQGDSGHVLEFALGAEDTLVCATSKHQLMSCAISNFNNVKEGTSSFEHIFAPCHSPNTKGEAEITGIDAALWRPIIVTAARDHSVRVWNPQDKKLELVKVFDEEPLGV